MKTILITPATLSPADNLALEEALLLGFDKLGADSVFMLWRNEASVIIGRNQNAFAEVDLALADKMKVPVVRRTTGGGAVFHDPGNINYTVITPVPDGRSDRSVCSQPVIRALAELGIASSLSGRNDIVSDGRKISGSAQRVENGVLLHHGTLLWSADLSRLAVLLRPDPDKLASKGIKSVSSRVGNLRDMLPPESPLAVLDGEGFFEELKAVFAREYVPAEPPAEILADAARLLEKYLSWDWNRGKSPAFSTEKSRRFPFGRITAGYEADRGRITKIAFTGDFIGDRPVAELEERLRGARLSEDGLAPLLRDSSDFFAGSRPEDLLSLLL